MNAVHAMTPSAPVPPTGQPARAAPAVAGRLMASLPAVYQQADQQADKAEGGGDLQALLGAFEAVLLGTPGAAVAEGFEQYATALPNLLAERRASGGFDAALRDAFVPWIASRWVGFAPFAHFSAERLRRIVAAIVPLYGRRGTPAYLLALLKLCFDEAAGFHLQEHLGGGLLVGKARIGQTSLLGSARAFSFALDVELRPRAGGWDAAALAAMRAALLATVEFAKPAHAVCELTLTVQAQQPTSAAPDPSTKSARADMAADADADGPPPGRQPN